MSRLAGTGSLAAARNPAPLEPLVAPCMKPWLILLFGCGLASLAGWGLMMLWSQPLGPCHVAIAHADIQYRRPLRGVFQATAHLPAEAETVRFHHAFQERGRGKLPVRIEVGDEQGAGVVQNAVYAVWRIEPPVV